MKKNNYLIILCISYLIPCNWAINVGIGISDVTGPAAEIGMVRFIFPEKKILLLVVHSQIHNLPRLCI